MTDQYPKLSEEELAARKTANVRLAIGLGLIVVAIYAGFILYRYF